MNRDDINPSAALEGIIKELTEIRAEMVASAAISRHLLQKLHPSHQESAENLLHYLALRRRDLRELQLQLAALGVSSLGRAEPHALTAVDAVLEVLRRLLGYPVERSSTREGLSLTEGQRLLAEHTEALLGPASPGRSTRIMVTMPSEAGSDYELVHDLLQQGMNCMRINCAHDNPATWLRMIEHLRRAERALGRPCQVMMDLAGPKLRTGPLLPGPAVVRIRPQRDVYGRVTAPARVWLTAEPSRYPPLSPADACLRVPARWLARLRVGAKIRFTDAREAKRAFTIADVTERGCWAESLKTAYVVPGTILHQPHGERDEREALIEEVPTQENALRLQKEDLLLLTRDLRPGRPATYDSNGALLSPAAIGCTLPEVFGGVRVGEPIWFDDGKIGGVIEKIEEGYVLVRIKQLHAGGDKLRADKGINLPESDLALSALTEKDIEDLSFVAEHADVVELSFANSPQDVELLQQKLAVFQKQLGIVLKIETERGFESLPEMLLAAMKAPRCGVMIARGDLAVECGFERLAEAQEEILWICEAAHVPVIWATQVLENLTKTGMPSRAEVTDAAMGHRAECVMLNKGPHIRSAVHTLDDILQRMQSHQSKKRSMLRELRVAHALETK